MVQNEFIEKLLETGLIGLGLFIVIIVFIFIKTKQQKYVWAILAAFLVQWWFFSGYPNALHIFLFMIFAYYFSSTSKKV